MFVTSTYNSQNRQNCKWEKGDHHECRRKAHGLRNSVSFIFLESQAPYHMLKKDPRKPAKI